jgi:DNA adenine methylase
VIAHPPCKWAGGKTALLPEILPRLPTKIGTYYEPFVGGGAVFFALAAEGRFKRAVLGDANEELMNVYDVIRREPHSLMLFLGRGFEQDEKAYYKIRAQDPKTLVPLARAARTLYLNKTGFNGLFRVNKKGGFNVPWGKQEGRRLFEDENILACSVALRETVLTSIDFGMTVASAKRGDVVYCDSPYVPLTPTANFTTYTAGGFGLADQTRLRDVAAKLVKRGVHVLLSNADTPLVRKLYRGFKIEKVQAPRRVNSKGSKRGNVGELLISGRNTKAALAHSSWRR